MTTKSYKENIDISSDANQDFILAEDGRQAVVTKHGGKASYGSGNADEFGSERQGEAEYEDDEEDYEDDDIGSDPEISSGVDSEGSGRSGRRKIRRPRQDDNVITS